jgi:hypothetical protein
MTFWACRRAQMQRLAKLPTTASLSAITWTEILVTVTRRRAWPPWIAAMTPFAVEQIWHAGRPVPVSEKGSTLALLLEATIQRITAAATAPSGCPCCRCSMPQLEWLPIVDVTAQLCRAGCSAEFLAPARWGEGLFE